MRKFAHLALLLLIGLLTTLTPLYAATFTVTSLADDGGPGELRWAINSANGSPGSNINFQMGLTGTITLTSTLPLIYTSTAIQGPGASVVTIDGSGNFQPFIVAAQGSIVLISGLKVQNCSDNIGNYPGGAVSIQYGNATIEQCAFSHCADDRAGGGAIYNSATATITNCSFNNDSSSNTLAAPPSGGAIFNTLSATLSVTNCSFTGNTAVSGAGGALCNSGTATITNCVFSGNQAASGGGAYSSSSSPLQITNCSFVGNISSSNNGNGIFIGQTAPPSTITNCIIFDGGANSYADFISYGQVSVTCSDIQSGYTGTGNINSNPQFANAPTDLHLAVGSPCIGTGTVAGAPTTTIDGQSRPNPPSIGAYEALQGTVTSPPGPTITSFTPSNGFASTPVTITGSGFTGTTSVKFNGASATFTVNSDTSISTTVPQAATSGPISVTTPSGITSSSNFVVPVFPIITSLSPTSGPVGTTVTVTGTGFTGVTGATFGIAFAAVSVSSDTSLTVVVPPGAASGSLALASQFGSTSSGPQFTVTAIGTITSFTPTSGPVGSSVTITGTKFTGATAVWFNGTNVSSFSVNSSTSITATVPPGATTGPITVIAPSGQITSSGTFIVTIPTASISSFTPTSGVAGTSVTITGTNFIGATAVRFNGTSAATFNVVSSSSITATVPAGATTGVITVTTPIGTATSSTNYTVTIPSPTISSFTPTSGPVGTSLTITGTNLTGASAVSFNGTGASTFSVVSSTSIAATVPIGATSGDISVTCPAGTAVSSTPYTIVTIPAIPTGFTATPGVNQIVLNWTAPSGALTYNLYRGTSSGTEGSVPYIAGLAGTSYTDSSATAGTAYYYKLTAVNTAGESSKSTEATATATAAVLGNVIQNPSFETPATTNYIYNPTGAGWTFASNCGIQVNGSGFSQKIVTSDGVQAAFLQGKTGVNGTISQTVTLTAGAHTLSFKAASRIAFYGGLQSFNVYIDSTLLGSYSPPGSTFVTYNTGSFTTTAGSHVLKFVGTSTTGDDTDFIDAVSLN